MKETNMADATPVSSQKKKGASAGIPEEVLKDLNDAAHEHGAVASQDTYKVEGGVELANHQATREDF